MEMGLGRRMVIAMVTMVTTLHIPGDLEIAKPSGEGVWSSHKDEIGSVHGEGFAPVKLVLPTVK